MDEFEKYFIKALHFLKYRPRSEKEVRDNLLNKFHKAESNMVLIERVIAKLKEHKFLNDEEFTKWWIEQRTRVNKKSLRLIKFELIKKGINKEMIDSMMKGLEHDVGSDLGRAKELVEKKIGKYKNLPRQELYQKLGAFLGRRGFDLDIIKQSIDEVLKKGV